MEADKNLSADIRKARSGNNAIAISQASISLSTSLIEPCLYYGIGKTRSGNNTIAISQASMSLNTSLTEPCLYEKAGESSASIRVTSHQMVSIWRSRAEPPDADRVIDRYSAGG